jgi:uncharacterized membrane protein
VSKFLRTILAAIAVLAVAGVGVSSLALYHHYGTSQTNFCDIGQNFNCDIVNRSVYSTLFGIPVALIGILGYAFLFALSTLCRNKAEMPLLLIMGATLGLGFAIYLTYIEAFVLGTWCIVCLSSAGIILLITVLSSVVMAQSMRRA